VLFDAPILHWDDKRENTGKRAAIG